MTREIKFRDKNGKEINEGDIVREKDVEKYTVIYDALCFMKECSSGRYQLQNTQYLEIIGNIYRDSHLLNDK